MQVHELACSSFLRLSSSQEFCSACLTRFKGGQVSWCGRVRSHIFGICQIVFFRHNNENGFLSNLGGGVRASLTFVIFFFKAFLRQRNNVNKMPAMQSVLSKLQV